MAIVELPADLQRPMSHSVTPVGPVSAATIRAAMPAAPAPTMAMRLGTATGS